MDLSFPTDFSILFNLDEDDINNSLAGVTPSHNHLSQSHAEVEKKTMQSPNHLYQQHQFNQICGETSIDKSEMTESTKQIGQGSTRQPVMPNHNDNHANLLLNGFVTALADRSSKDALQNNHQNALKSTYQASTSTNGNILAGGPAIAATAPSSSSMPMELQQQQQTIPQHLQPDVGVGVGTSSPSPPCLTNQFWHLQDASNHVNGSTCNGGATVINSNAPPQVEQIFPPNYFLPGMGSWDPSQALPNSSIVNTTSTVKVSGAGGNANIGGTRGERNPTTTWRQQVQQNPSIPNIIYNHPVVNNPLSISGGDQTTTTTTTTTNSTGGQSMLNTLRLPHSSGTVSSSLPCLGNLTATNLANLDMNQNGTPKPQALGDRANSNTEQQQQLYSNNNVSVKVNRRRQHKQQQEGKSKAPSSKRARKSKSKTEQQKQVNETPPFYLFDAPCELRTNFIQAQNLHNIAIVPDDNSYHYGMAANGFHPQLNAQTNPQNLPILSSNGSLACQQQNQNPPTTAAAGTAMTQPSPTHVVLLDGRQKDKAKPGNERNEREQQRAQKITELIDKLRTTMLNDGWKQHEMKSKYQTLSTCASYIKHLIEEKKKKEAAVEAAKADLAIKEQKLERDKKILEDKALQDSRSDPESVTSSLTASSEFRSSAECVAISKSSGENSNDNNDENENIKKEDDGVGGDGLDSTTSGGQECTTRRPDVKNISVDKMSSSVSEMTDNNASSKACSGSATTSGDEKVDSLNYSDPSCTEDVKGRRDSSSIPNECVDNKSEPSSISSTAAVFSGSTSRERDHLHSDVVIKGSRDRKRRHVKEKTSLEADFELNYQEVFLSSNIPQLIATQTGRIVTCNDFFRRATGLNDEDIQRITIFSIVQHSKLPMLFELVATSVRRSINSTSIGSSVVSDLSVGLSSDSSLNKGKCTECKSITLPCVPFPKGVKPGDDEETLLNPLYMTVTFMSDDNPRNRCIHCLLTDAVPGEGGNIGSITPKVLKKMFSENGLGVAETSTT